ERRQHAEPEDIDLEEPELLEVVLVPLDHGALGHRRVLDRHEAIQRTVRDHEAADVLGQMPRETEDLPDEGSKTFQERTVGIEPDLLQPLRVEVAVPPRSEERRV